MPSIQSKPPSGIALTEAKVMRCVAISGRETMTLSKSHGNSHAFTFHMFGFLAVSFIHPVRSRLFGCRMPPRSFYFLPQTGQLTGLKLSRCVCHPWKPETYLFQERTASVPVCMTFQVARRKARPHGGCYSHGFGSPPCKQKEFPYLPYEP